MALDSTESISSVVDARDDEASDQSEIVERACDTLFPGGLAKQGVYIDRKAFYVPAELRAHASTVTGQARIQFFERLRLVVASH